MLFISFCVNALSPLSIYPNHFCLISLHFRYRHFPFSHSPPPSVDPTVSDFYWFAFSNWIDPLFQFDPELHLTWSLIHFQSLNPISGRKEKIQNGTENKNSLMLCQTLIQHSIPESLQFFLVFKFSSFKFSFVICSDCNNKRFEESSQQHHLKKKKKNPLFR